ncbi:MAG: hypothetical protein MN733_44215, partial [Nitrososphaera sp.]|nr:hypothetical protein [Nitrososphaera sp.]
RSAPYKTLRLLHHPSFYQVFCAYNVTLQFRHYTKPSLDFIEVSPITPAPTVEDEPECILGTENEERRQD